MYYVTKQRAERKYALLYWIQVQALRNILKMPIKTTILTLLNDSPNKLTEPFPDTFHYHKWPLLSNILQQ